MNFYSSIFLCILPIDKVHLMCYNLARRPRPWQREFQYNTRNAKNQSSNCTKIQALQFPENPLCIMTKMRFTYCFLVIICYNNNHRGRVNHSTQTLGFRALTSVERCICFNIDGHQPSLFFDK